jgi:hypothetical protein
MSARAELHSVGTRLSELVAQVGSIAESLAADERDEVGPDLFEVERTLQAAQRRLRRLLDR